MRNKDKGEQQEIHITQSFEQQGGITAHTVNINGVMPARARVSEVAKEETSDGFKTRFEVVIESQYALPQLKVAMASPTLEKLDVVETSQMMLSISGVHGTVAEGAAKGQPIHVLTVQNAAGRYVFEALTKLPEFIELQINQ